MIMYNSMHFCHFDPSNSPLILNPCNHDSQCMHDIPHYAVRLLLVSKMFHNISFNAISFHAIVFYFDASDSPFLLNNTCEETVLLRNKNCPVIYPISFRYVTFSYSKNYVDECNCAMGSVLCCTIHISNYNVP